MHARACRPLCCRVCRHGEGAGGRLRRRLREWRLWTGRLGDRRLRARVWGVPRSMLRARPPGPGKRDARVWEFATKAYAYGDTSAEDDAFAEGVDTPARRTINRLRRCTYSAGFASWPPSASAAWS